LGPDIDRNQEMCTEIVLKISDNLNNLSEIFKLLQNISQMNELFTQNFKKLCTFGDMSGISAGNEQNLNLCK
jgi:hypothetical protein